MWFFVLNALIPVSLLAQEMGAGSRVTLVLSAPAAVGDRIEVLSSSDSTGFVLVTPEGRRITAANAAEEGFGWYERKLDRVEPGKSMIIPFRRPAPGGRYAIEVRNPTTLNSKINVSLDRVNSPSYVSPRFPGAVVFAFPMHAPGTITLALKEDGGPGVIDILTSNVATEVALTLPDGRRITAASAASESLEWKTTTDPFTAPAQVAGLLFPHPGRHHLIYFQSSPHGSYQIRTVDPAAQGEFRALFLPYEQHLEKHPEERAVRQSQSPERSDTPSKEVQPVCRVSLLSVRVAGRPNREGRVVLSAWIDEQGKAHDVKVIRSPGTDLARDAIDYVEHCAKHTPGQGFVTVDLDFRVI